MKNPLSRRTKSSDKIRILHFIPGRVRLKVAKEKLHSRKHILIEKNLRTYPEIKNVSISPVTSTILVHYEVTQVTISRIIQRVVFALNKYSLLENANPITLDKFSENIRINKLSLATIGILLSMVQPLRLLKPEILSLLLLNKSQLKEGYTAVINSDKNDPNYYFFLSILFSIFSGHSKFRLAALILNECSSILSSSLDRKSDIHFQKYFPEIPETIERLNPAGIEETVPSIDIQSGDRIFYRRDQVVHTDSEVIQGIASTLPHQIFKKDEEISVRVSDSIRSGDRVKSGKLLVKVIKPPYNSWLQGVKHQLDFSDQFLNEISSVEEQKQLVPSYLFQAAIYFMMTRDLAFGLDIASQGYSSNLKRSSKILGKHLVASSLQESALIPDRSNLINSFQHPVILMDNIHSIFEENYLVRSVLPAVIDAKPSRILELAGACEENIHHPIADAISSYINLKKIPIPDHSSSVHVKGFGTETIIDDMIIRTGSRQFMDQRDITTQTANDVSHYMESRGWLPLFVSVDSRIFGVIGLEQVLNRPALSFMNAVRGKITPHCYVLSESGAWYTETISAIVPNNKYQPQDLPDFLAMLKRQHIETTVLTSDNRDSERFNDASHIIHLGKNNISENLEKSHTCIHSENLVDLFKLLDKSRISAKLLNQNLNTTLLFHLMWFILGHNRIISSKWNPVLKEIISLFNLLNVHRISKNRVRRS